MDERKLDRLDSYLAEGDLSAVWFARPNGFAWLTGGDNRVDRAAEVGVAAAGYDGDGVTVVTDDIEGPRLAAEELPDPVAVETYPWHERSLAEAVADRSPDPAAADFPVPGFDDVDASGLRQPLTSDDVRRYRRLGTETAAAVEAVCRDAAREDTERAVAARLRGSLAERGIDAPVALVGGAERAGRYRHFTPKDVRLGDYALVSVTTTRGGLFASCTRTVAFDPPSWLRERHRSAARVEATALAATRAVGRRGGDAGAVFDAVRHAYAEEGYPEEWRSHHQGGAAGFAGREWIATPDSPDPVRIPMAYAWNPTVHGAKSEDTVLVREGGYETLTRTDDWPTRRVGAVDYDETFERPDVLER
ncbi:peptidase [Halobacteriales archaeon QS_8_69_26]|nr:MAG: peptidase [Halobacteriales archaeon QS_8_69_26]